MVDLTTTYYGFTKPTVGADNNTWGGLINTDLDSIDSSLHAVSVVASAAVARSGDTMTGALVATEFDWNGGSCKLRLSGSLVIFDFAYSSNDRLTFNLATGATQIIVNNIAIMTIDSDGNAVFKGTVTQNGTP
jgi:hypothetical protein